MLKICSHEMRFEDPKYVTMRLRPGLRPDPTGGAYSAPPYPLAVRTFVALFAEVV